MKKLYLPKILACFHEHILNLVILQGTCYKTTLSTKNWASLFNFFLNFYILMSLSTSVSDVFWSLCIIDQKNFPSNTIQVSICNFVSICYLLNATSHVCTNCYLGFILSRVPNKCFFSV